MRTFTKFLLILSLLVCLLSPLPGFCALTSGDLQKDELVLALKMGVFGELGFDPCKGWGRYGSPLFQSTLLTLSSELTYGYDLATEYGVSENGLVWTYKIRDDAKFSDGVPVRASDVAFTYNTAKNIASYFDFSLLKEAKAINFLFPHCIFYQIALHIVSSSG
jgi:peptide/nickel transport system substrate-binding protein